MYSSLSLTGESVLSFYFFIHLNSIKGLAKPIFDFGYSGNYSNGCVLKNNLLSIFFGGVDGVLLKQGGATVIWSLGFLDSSFVVLGPLILSILLL